MAVVPGFKYDLFVSYAHQNDRPWGWVSEFIKTLKEELEGKSREFSIWWDPALRTGEDFNLGIGEAISQSAVFLSVLSLAYGDSTYCRREIEEFRQQRHPAFGLTVGSMSRMQAIVIEKEFTRERWAPEFRTTSPHPFYSDQSSLFSRPTALSSTDPWIQGLWKVRDSVWTTLQQMRQQKEQGTAVERSYDNHVPEGAKIPTISVSEVTDDLYRRREGLRSSLAQDETFHVAAWSEPVLPPDTGSGDLSVHLFGKYPGHAYRDSELSLPRLQLDLAISAKPARRPVVWVARDLKFEEAESEEHADFLNSLAANRDIELLRTDFEDFKDELQNRMRVAKAPAARSLRPAREAPIVHIWHQGNDASTLNPLKQYLNESNCGISVFNCASTDMEKMQSRLAVCDGLIVPYTANMRTWAEDILTEAFRLRRREERPTAFAAVELPPASDEEFNFEHPRVMPIHMRQPGAFEQMDSFLAKLEP